MLRRLLIALVTGLLAVAAAPVPAAAQVAERPRVMVLWIDGTTIGDWASPALRHMGELLGRAAVASVSARTNYDGDDYQQAVLAAAEVAGSGASIRGVPTGAKDGTALLAGLAVAGRAPVLITGAAAGGKRAPDRAFGPDGTVPGRSFARRDASFPGGIRTDIQAMAAAVAETEFDMLIVEIPDVVRVERRLRPGSPARTRWVELTMQRVDRVLGVMRRQMREQDAIVVLAPTPPASRLRAGTPLGAVAVMTGRSPAGLLRSGSGTRPGLVSLTDVMPTLLVLLGVEPSRVEPAFGVLVTTDPPRIAGAAMTVQPRNGAVSRLRALEAELLDTASSHTDAVRGLIIPFMILLVGGIGVVVAGRASARARSVAAVGLLAACAYPGSMFLAPSSSRPSGMVAAVVIAVVVAVTARRAQGSERGLAVILLLTAVVVTIDVLLGGQLAARMPLLEPLAAGVRMRAADGASLGLVLASLAGAGVLLDRSRPTDRAGALAVLGAGAVAVFVFASEGLGGDAGSVLVLGPAFLIVAIAAAGTPVGRHTIVASGAAAIGMTGAVLLTYGPSIWVEERPLIPWQEIPDRLAGRADVLADQATSIWLVAAAVAAALLLALVARRRALLDRGWWGRPHLRVTLGAVSAGAVLAVGCVLGGIATLGMAGTITAAAAVMPLLSPEEQERTGRQRRFGRSGIFDAGARPSAPRVR